MAIYLVQHGISNPKEVDIERGLSSKGKDEVAEVAEKIARLNIQIDEIWHSGKKRAAQTAKIFDVVLKPARGVVEKNGLAPMDDVYPMRELVVDIDNIMLVGHLPFMERLVTLLVCNELEPPVIIFKNSGVVCLELEDVTGKWHVKWTLFP